MNSKKNWNIACNDIGLNCIPLSQQIRPPQNAFTRELCQADVLLQVGIKSLLRVCTCDACRAPVCESQPFVGPESPS
eukprot:6160235-Amphidinium_carterae.1